MRRGRPDLFTEVTGLQARLRADHVSPWADELDDAVLGGATGTEIRGRVGAVLDRVRRAGDVPTADRRTAARLLRTIRRDARRP